MRIRLVALFLLFVGGLFYYAYKSQHEHVLKRRANIMSTAPFHTSPDRIYSGKTLNLLKLIKMDRSFLREKKNELNGGMYFNHCIF